MNKRETLRDAKQVAAALAGPKRWVVEFHTASGIACDVAWEATTRDEAARTWLERWIGPRAIWGRIRGSVYGYTFLEYGRGKCHASSVKRIKVLPDPLDEMS